MYYTFQESTIWDSNLRVDTSRKPVRLKAKSLEKAKKRLPKSGLGRSWILVDVEIKNG